MSGMLNKAKQAVHEATAPKTSTTHTTTTGNTTYDSTAGGYGSTTHATHGSTNAGPHNSNIMNKADPRVDSDRDHRNDPTSRVGGYGTQHNSAGYDNTSGYGGTHTTGTHHTTGTTGAGYGGSNYNTSATPGSGNANNTAGPHNSNLLNKLDPRVDSDMDGGKTYGGNQTYR